MSGWTDVFLGIIAVTTLVTAVLQVGLLFAAGKVMASLARLTVRIEEEVRPLAAHLDSIGRDAARASSLAVAQVERADALFTDVAARIVSTMDIVQRAAGIPAREAAAIASGFKAVFSVLRDSKRGRPRGRAEDEDQLFI